METELTTATTQIIVSGGVEVFSRTCFAWVMVEFVCGAAMIFSGGKK